LISVKKYPTPPMLRSCSQVFGYSVDNIVIVFVLNSPFFVRNKREAMNKRNAPWMPIPAGQKIHHTQVEGKSDVVKLFFCFFSFYLRC